MKELKVWYEPIHPLDGVGSLHFSFERDGHVLSFTPVWFACGETGFNISCSCGFYTEQREGHGCWQDGHDVRTSPFVDETHLKLLLRANHEALPMNDVELQRLLKELCSLEVLSERVPVAVLFSLVLEISPDEIQDFPVTYLLQLKENLKGKWGVDLFLKNPILSSLLLSTDWPTATELEEKFGKWHKLEI